jgi:hypothetical protein
MAEELKTLLDDELFFRCPAAKDEDSGQHKVRAIYR